MSFVGEVKEVKGNECAVTYEWRIPDLSQLQRPNTYVSPTVTYFNMKWVLYAHNNMLGIDTVNLVWGPSNRVFKGSIHFSIACKTSDGKERDLVRDQTISNFKLDSPVQLSPWWIPLSAGLTITVSLWKPDSFHATGVSRDTQTESASCGCGRMYESVNPGSEDISILREHFKKLFLSGDGHDVLIKVGDKQFRAHKHILKSRSAVFEAMFGVDMAESAGGTVTIEDCDPDSFGQFLQFVYSGAVDVASVRSALDLYYVGDKYNFQSLKDICVDFLKGSFTTTTVFDVVSLAARHGEEELLQEAIVYMSKHLKEVMRTVEWQRFLLANPIQANEMCLKAMDCNKS